MKNLLEQKRSAHWRTDATAMAFFLAAFIIVFWKVIFLGHYYLPPSTSYHELAYNFSLRELAANSWNSLTLPLWNPTISLGLPLMEGNTSTSLSPFYLPYFINPTPYMLGITQILHLFLLAFFTHKFLYELTGNLSASCAAGLIASLNGFTLTWSIQGTSYINTVTMLPLILLTIERYLCNPLAKRQIYILPVFTGIMFLMALVPSGFFVFSAAWTYALVRLIGRWHAIKKQMNPLKVFVLLNLSLAAGLVIGAAQLLPVYHLLSLGARGSKTADYFNRAGLTVLDLGAMGFNMLMPHFFGRVDRSISFKNMLISLGPVEYIFSSASSYFYCYFGIAAIPLSAAAFLNGKKNWTLLLFALLVPLFLLLIKIMLVKKLLYIITAGMLFNMFLNFSMEIFFMTGIPLIIGIGINDLMSLDPAKLRKYFIALASFVAVLVAGYLVFNIYLIVNKSDISSTYHASISRALLSGAVTTDHSPSYYHERFAFFFDAFVQNLPLTNFRTSIPLAIAISFVIASYVASKQLLSPNRFGAVILCLTMLDLVLFSSGYIITVSPNSFLPEFSFIQYLKKDPGLFRIAALYSDDYGREGQKAFKIIRPYEHFNFNEQSDDGTLLSVAREKRIVDYQWYSNLPSHYGLHSILGADTVVMSDYRKYLSAVENGNLANLEAGMVFKLFNSESRLLDLANVKYLLATYDLRPSEHLTNVFSDGGLRVYENKNVLPRAYLSENVIVEPNADVQLALLSGGEIDYRNTVLLEKMPAIQYGNAQSPAGTSGTVSIGNYSNNSVILDVHASRPAIVVLLDRYFPGWKVVVDGEEKELLRVNYLFRGVAVPSGKHTVEFRYRPTRLFIALAISASVLLLCIILYFRQHCVEKGKTRII